MLRNISIALLVLVTLAVSGCSSGVSTATPNSESSGIAALSDLNAVETEAEIGRLLRDGYWMYTSTRVFPGARLPDVPCRTARVICDTYPEVTVIESWQSTDSSGLTENSYGRRSREDGTVLATAIQGVWTDMATGEQWGTAVSAGSDLIAFIRDSFTKIERERERGLEVIEGEILGRPSVVIPEGEFEYQVANPLIQRTTRWQDDGKGGREMVSDLRVLNFAMLPPDALPDFAKPAS